MDINPQIIEKNGKKEFVILPYEDFLKIQEELHRYEDLRLLREAKESEGDAPGIGMEEARKRLGIE